VSSQHADTTSAAASFDADLMTAVSDLGDALRELVETSVGTAVGAEQLREAAERVRAASAGLAVSLRPAHQLPSLDDPVAFRRVYNPVDGVGSALAPPLTVRRGEGGVVAETALGLAYEGPPGYLHGGVSGLLMDQVLGDAALAAGQWGMTVRLELDYRRPVPLRTPLVLRGRVLEATGRKVVVGGTIALAAEPDVALVEARGVFVAPRADKQDAYFGAVTDASGRPAPPGRPTDGTQVH
jgi:acyl-coenzyme A thioesterase PaaI-like protein